MQWADYLVPSAPARGLPHSNPVCVLSSALDAGQDTRVYRGDLLFDAESDRARGLVRASSVENSNREVQPA